MCGIAGLVHTRQDLSPESLEMIATAMSSSLKHRGPDDAGLWKDQTQGLVLAHRRLSVLDLSPHGHQPFVSPDGRYVLVYNGEIYNHPDIKSDLVKKYNFQGHSDTEVLMAALMVWGIDDTLRRLNGMFAFALYDQQDQKIFLARDRLGVKPLYVVQQADVFMFASEIKAFNHYPHFDRSINHAALATYFQMGFLPPSQSIYKSVTPIKPGYMMVVDVKDLSVLHYEPWWRLPQGPSANTTTLAQIQQALTKSVARRMVADVPVGVMLSGGIDSSLIAALMQAGSSQKINSFSIGFAESAFNEADHAKRIAAHLGTQHHQFVVKPEDALALIPSLPYMYDEPFGDSSALPTLLLSKMIRQHVTVALSGDGGDEVFLGYNRHRYFNHLMNYRALPMFMRQGVSKLVDLLPLEARLKDKAAKFCAGGLGHDLPESYAQLFKGWPAEIMPQYPPKKLEGPAEFTLENLQRFDFKYYLPGDILTKVDRASMAHALEVRNPFLDVDVVEAAYHLPLELKLEGSVTKVALRQILAKYIPKPLFERPKTGFAIPLAVWLRGELKDWAQDLLHAQSFQHCEFLNHPLIHATWRDFQKGDDLHMHRLWSVLMFASWHSTLHSSSLGGVDGRGFGLRHV